MNELPNLNRALLQAVDAVRWTWVNHVTGADPLPGVTPLETAFYWVKKYAESIRPGEQLAMADVGYFKGTVVAVDPVAGDIEFGRAPWDMKDMLLSGRKVKRSTKGKRYLVVPFRHGHAGDKDTLHFPAMPKDIYAAAKQLDFYNSAQKTGKLRIVRNSERRLSGYKVLKQHNALSFGTKPQKGRSYHVLTGTEGAYPPRLHEITRNRKSGHDLAEPIRYQHKSGIYERMMRMNGPKQAEYRTFRVVSDNSDPSSWWHPGWHPHRIAEGIVEVMQPRIERVLEEAARLDLVSIPNLSVGMRLTSA